LTVDNRKQFDN
jgi:hypothetical protein